MDADRSLFRGRASMKAVMAARLRLDIMPAQPAPPDAAEAPAP
jgi:hypothetical protein